MSADRDDAPEDLAALADELVEMAAAMRRRWTELLEALGGVAEQPGDEAPAAPDAEADPVRLVALDMMLAGHSREEVRDYLESSFGEGASDEVLDEVFSRADRR